jgi:N-methylhydantoinase A
LHNISEGIIDLTIRRGLDVRDLSLVAYGAAGPMLLPDLLDLLPLESVVVPPNPGGFSALGLLSSDRVFTEVRTHYGILGPDLGPELTDLFADLETKLVDRADVDPDEATILRAFDGRLLGQGRETPFVPVSSGPIGTKEISQMVESFHEEYELRNGHRFEAFPVEAVNFRAQLVVHSDKVVFEELPTRRGGVLEPRGSAELTHRYTEPVTASCYERDDLLAGDVVSGPAVVWEANSTTFVPKDRTAVVGKYGELVVT